jgi:hypothetical protein
MLAQVAAAGAGTMSVTATAADPPAPPDRPQIASRAAGTWGACGSWWSETATESTSGSVCGVDGLVTENGVPTQLAEPLVTVSRSVCLKRKRGAGCTSEDFSGTVRRSDMTVDPLLRRATIRGVLGGCTLDVEFAGIGPAEPGGNLSQWHGGSGGPQVGVNGGETFTNDARWWGGVCGRTVIVDGGQGQASMFRGAEASISGFGGQGGCECCECAE